MFKAIFDVMRINHRNLIITFCAVPILVGLTVIFGWTIESSSIVQISPLFVPMQFNTALCFFAAGIGCLSAYYSKFIVTALSGIGVFTVGLLTLFQYMYDIDLGIDQFFHTPEITVLTSHAGRMSPNSAVGFLIIGLGLVMEAAFWEEIYFKIRYWLLGGAAIALGANSLSGYLLQVKVAVGWAYSGMAVHTSLCFIALGIAIISLGFLRIKKHQLKQQILGKSLIVFMLVAGFALFVAQYAKFNQMKRYLSINSAHADSAAYFVSRALNLIRLDTINRLGVWSNTDDPNQMRNQMKEYINDYPDIGYLVLYASQENDFPQTPFIVEANDQNKDSEASWIDLSQLSIDSRQTTLFSQNHIILSSSYLSNHNNVRYKLITILPTENVIRYLTPDYIQDNFKTSINELPSKISIKDTWINLSFSKKIQVGNWTGYLNLSDPERHLVYSQFLWWLIFLQGVFYAFLLASLSYLLHFRNLDKRSLELIQDTTSSGLIEVDSDGIITFANRSACELFAYNKDQMLRMPIEMLVPIDAIQHEGYRNDFVNENKNRRMGAGVLYGKKSSNEIFPISVDLNIIQASKGVRILATITDLTERQSILSSLQKQNALFTGFLQKTNEYFIEVDSDYIIVSANSSFENNLGYNSGELIGKPLQSICDQKPMDSTNQPPSDSYGFSFSDKNLTCSEGSIYLLSKHNDSIYTEYLFLAQLENNKPWDRAIFTFFTQINPLKVTFRRQSFS